MLSMQGDAHIISGAGVTMLIARAICFVLTLSISGTIAAGDSSFNGLEGHPGLRSASALVLDAQGNVIYGKDIDTIRPIASITKLMTAMVILDAALDLDKTITITHADRDTIKRTGSRLAFGAALSRRELLLLALMSSENRAASALGRTFPGGVRSLVTAMNQKAGSLGMASTRFADPAGLNANNQSTASDLAKMLAAAEGYPLITRATTTRKADVRPYSNRGPLTYSNTNRLLKNDKWAIELSKTGFIREAGRCLVMQANIGGENISIVLLNSFGKLTPYGDSNRLRKWMLAQS
ncbi:MAG: serine hydrolase [Halioglobus sp.]|nr:serine hydrolase [Halioglobus sp.]